MANSFKEAVGNAELLLTGGTGLNGKQTLLIRDIGEGVNNLYYYASTQESEALLHDLKYVVVKSKSVRDKEAPLEEYIIVFGLSLPAEPDSCFDSLLDAELENVDGPQLLWIYLYLLLNKKISLREDVTIREIDERILGRNPQSEEERISVEDFEYALEKIVVFKKGPCCRFTSNSRAMYYICAMSGKYQPLGSSKLRDKYADTFLQGADNLTYENLFLAMTSSHWKHVVIELYRSVENLFSVPMAMEFKKTVGFSGSTRDLIKLCVQDLKWKRNERNSLIKLFSLWGKPKIMASEVMKIEAFNSLKVESDNFIDSFGDKIYQIRNQLVHQFEFYQEAALSSDDFDKLAVFVLDVIVDLYIYFDEELIIT